MIIANSFFSNSTILFFLKFVYLITVVYAWKDIFLKISRFKSRITIKCEVIKIRKSENGDLYELEVRPLEELGFDKIKLSAQADNLILLGDAISIYYYSDSPNVFELEQPISELILLLSVTTLLVLFFMGNLIEAIILFINSFK